MDNQIYIATEEEVKEISRALDSDLRRRIIKLLGRGKMNVGEIARQLAIPQSTCVVNIQILEKAKIIQTEQVAASKGVQKVCFIPFREVVLPLQPESRVEEEHVIVTEMPIGLYTDCQVSTPCGLVNESSIIGYLDQVDSFFHPKRASAGLLWFASGYCEYRFPAKMNLSVQKVMNIRVSMEICSEFPGFKNDWPSDITLWINDKELGTWRSPGDMGSTVGRFTPRWWDLQNTQFGFLKTWKVSHDGSFIDGEAACKTTLRDIRYDECEFFEVRVGVKDDAKFCGGMNLFGRSFGNYEQDIVLKIELDR